MGSTIQAMNLAQLKTQENIKDNNSPYNITKKQYIRYILKQYVSNGYRLNNTPKSIDELSQMLEVSTNYIVGEIGRGARMWFDVRDKEKVTDGVGMMVMKLMEASIRDRGDVEDNLANLKRALVGPNGKAIAYKAFVSAEYNRALGVNLASQKALLEATQLLIKLAGLEGPKTNPTININNHNEANLNQPTTYLTTEKAIELLVEEKGHILLPEGQGQILEAEYIDESVPDVNPLTQSGYGSDKSKVNLKATKGMKGFGHEDRREGLNEILS